jgi:hypothetical protein
MFRQYQGRKTGCFFLFIPIKNSPVQEKEANMSKNASIHLVDQR